MTTRKSLTKLLATSLLTAAAYSGTASAAGQDVFFFEDGIPAGFQATGKSELSPSTRHFKDGLQSIAWSFEAGDKLVINRPIGFKPFKKGQASQASHAFATWIYNETPVADQIEFVFSTGDVINTRFPVNMNFKGWRAVVVPFEADMTGTASAAMNRLTIEPPKSLEQGIIHFDQMALSIPVDPRWPARDYQVPYVNKTVDTRANAHWSALLTYDNWLQAYDQLEHAPITNTELHAMRRVMQRIDTDLLEGSKKVNKQTAKSLLKEFTKYTTTTNSDASTRLKPVALWRQIQTFHSAGLADEKLKFLDQTTVRLREMGAYMLKLAQAYHQIEQHEIKQELAAAFNSIVRHMAEQGYMRGSSFGVMHHQGYSMKQWAQALYLMRGELGDYLPAAQQALGWALGLGRMLRPEQDIDGFNVDVMNTMLQGMIFSALMVPNEQQRVIYLRKLSEWMNFSMLNHKGLSGGIQEDGSFFHHRQHYVAYGNGGLNGLTPVVYYFSDTPFAMNDQAYSLLRHGVLMSRIFSNDTLVPMSLSGRHPDGKADITLTPFKYLSKVDLEQGNIQQNDAVAAAYLRLLAMPLAKGALKKDNIKQKLIAAGVTAEPDPSGSWVMNYSSLTLHRRDDWLASARGFSRYLVGSEIYRSANHYGRYINYGHLEILPSNGAKRAFSQAGWDWNRWPGTTTIHLPLSVLAAQIDQEDAFSGHEEMLRSTESFSGGNQLGNKAAMFAMKLRGHPKYDNSFKARKSVFFLDDHIVALGSGINNSDTKHITQTTLFQDVLRETDAPTQIKEIRQLELGFDSQLVTNQGFYLLDTNDNGYYIPKGQNVELSRKTQNSFENKHKTPTQGNFATAIINHGRAPENAGYEYAILVKAGAARTKAFALKMEDNSNAPYQVLQRDDAAHIVKSRSSGIFSYAIFTKSHHIKHGLLKSVSKPSMVMMQEENNLLTMSIVDPDLGFFKDSDEAEFDENGELRRGSIYSKAWPKNDPEPKVIQFTLEGMWHIMDQGTNYHIVQADNKATVIQVTSYASTPIQLNLCKYTIEETSCNTPVTH